MLDWPALMRAGIGGLGLMPEAFWALTPGELALLLGAGDGAALGLTRGRLGELMERYPDKMGEAARDE